MKVTQSKDGIILAYDIAVTHDLSPVDRTSQVTVLVQVIVGEKSPAGIHDVGGNF